MPELTVEPSGSATAPPMGPARVIDWVKSRERVVLALAVVMHLGVLLTIVGMRLLMLHAGETVLLRVVPVDPRDLLRGEYVILGYEFSQIPPEGIEGLAGPPERSQGQTVYVPLVTEEDGIHWKGGRITAERPTTGTFLRGKVTGWRGVEFGIESYFVEEGEGLAYERAIQNKRLFAEVAVAPDGRAALKGLRIE